MSVPGPVRYVAIPRQFTDHPALPVWPVPAIPKAPGNDCPCLSGPQLNTLTESLAATVALLLRRLDAIRDLSDATVATNTAP